MNDARCFDCFADLPPDVPCFAVLKQMRDIPVPPDAIEPPSFFHSQQFDPVAVCEDCAGWYGDDALRMR